MRGFRHHLDCGSLLPLLEDSPASAGVHTIPAKAPRAGHARLGGSGDINRTSTPAGLARASGSRLPQSKALRAILLSSFVLLPSSFLLAGWVAETSAELSTQGDWNADGTPDLLVVDRATGVLRVALQQGAVLTWQEPIATGVEGVSSLAYGQFNLQGLPKAGLAVTSPTLNRVQLIFPGVAEPQAAHLPGIGLNALVSLAGGPAGGGGLVAASTLNPHPQPWHLSQLGDTASLPADALLERGNEVTSSLYGFIARQQPTESFRLHSFSVGGPVALAWKTASGLPAGADWATGQFTATVSLREFLFWQSGQPLLHVRTFDQAAAPPDFDAGSSFDLGAGIEQVAVLPGTTPPRLLVVFSGGASAGVYDFDGVNAPVLAHTLTPEAGETFRSALEAGAGDFHLLSGTAGSASSTSARRWRRQADGSYLPDAAATLPVIPAGIRRANLLLFSGEPFVDETARLVSTLTARDWTATAAGLPGSIQTLAEIYQSSTLGLGQASTVNLGASTAGPTHALPNQYAEDVSIALYAPPAGVQGPELRLNPPPGTYGGPLNVTISANGLTPPMQVRYRTDPTLPWQTYDSATQPSIPITGTLRLESYVVSSGVAVSAVAGGLYVLGTGSSPALPFTLAATDTTATSVTLHGSVNPNGSATAARFDHGITAGLGTSSAEQPLGAGSSPVAVSLPLTGLLPHKMYHFRVTAVGSSGTNFGQKLTFTTLNRPPVFADATVNGSEDSPVSAQLSASDADNDALTFTKLTDPTHGTLTLSSSGSLNYIPAANFSGSDVFTAKVADGFGGEDTAVITLQIANVNDAPVALAQTLNGFRNTPLTVTLTASDEEGGPYTLWEVVTPPAHGTLTGTAPYLEYTPSNNFTGTDTFSFRVKDDGPAFSAPALVTLSISPNSPPGNVRTWVGGIADLWSQNTSWDPALVPTSPNHVIVPAGGQANLNVDARVTELSLTGALVSGPASVVSAGRRLEVQNQTTIQTFDSRLAGGDFRTGGLSAPEGFMLDAADLVMSGSFAHTGGGVELRNGSTFTNEGDYAAVSSFGVVGTGSGNAFHNTGTYRRINETSILQFGVPFFNAGAVFLESGSLSMVSGASYTQTAGSLRVNHNRQFLATAPIAIQGGTLAGGGTVSSSAGVIIGDATVAPQGDGSSPAAVLTVGGLSLSAGSKLAIDLGGAPSSGLNDQVTAFTSAPLARNGTLEVRFVGNYQQTVQAADSFTILTCLEADTGNAMNTTGQFSNVIAGRVNTADYFGSFAVNAAGTHNVVLSDFQPYPFILVASDLVGVITNNVTTPNFGVRNVGQMGPVQTFTIYNLGRASLTGISAALAGVNQGDFILTTPAVSTLAPGASTTFTVRFNPAAQGPRSARVEISSNDPNDGTFIIPLSGTGNAPPVLQLPASPLIVEATSLSGARVTFTVTATDAEDTSPPTANATPPSGSLFPVGDTTVNVTATDSTGATTNGSFIVQVVYPPPVLVTLTPEVSYNAASLRASVTPRGQAATVRFEYGTTPALGSSTSPQDAGGGFAPVMMAFDANGLEPATLYHARLVVTTSAGTFTSPTLTFTTLPVAAAPIARHDALHGVQDQTLYIQAAELLGNDLPGPSGLSFQIVNAADAINGQVSNFGGTIYFTPDFGFTGQASFIYTITNNQGGSSSATVLLDVAAPPVQPRLYGTASYLLPAGGTTPWTSFVVGPELEAVGITLTAASDNPALLPVSRIDLDGSGPTRRLRLRPLSGQTGLAVVTLTATSRDGLTTTADYHLAVVSGPAAKTANIMQAGVLDAGMRFASAAAIDLSADGSHVLGVTSGPDLGAWFWTADQGSQLIGQDFTPTAISADGLTILGTGYGTSGLTSLLWTEALGFSEIPGGAELQDLSADASAATGHKTENLPNFQVSIDAVRWTPSGGLTVLARPPGFTQTRATAISADGSTIIGWGTDANFLTHAIVWPASGPPIVLPAFAGAGFVQPNDLSADGAVIVGYSEGGTDHPGLNLAVRWVRGTSGTYTLHPLPAAPITDSSIAFSVSADGSKITGHAPSGPFLWTASEGIQNLQNLLLTAGLDITSASWPMSSTGHWDWLGEPAAISADGRFIIGIGGMQGSFSNVVWRIELPHGPVADPVLTWRQLHFGTTANTGDAADLADPENDGRTNLEEFAFGTPPLSAVLGPLHFSGGIVLARGSPVAVPAGALGNPQPLAVFCRRIDHAAAGLTYTVLFSFDLIHKVPSATVPIVLATDGEIEVVAIPYPAAITTAGNTAPPQFFQVQISR